MRTACPAGWAVAAKAVTKEVAKVAAVASAHSRVVMVLAAMGAVMVVAAMGVAPRLGSGLNPALWLAPGWW